MASVNVVSVDENGVQVLAQDNARTGYTLEHKSGDPIEFAYGVAAEFGKGFTLTSSKPNFDVPAHMASFGLFAITDTGTSGTVGVAEA